MIRDYALKRLKEDANEAERFAEWAFGENYLKLCGGWAFVDAWNNLHGESLYIYGSDEIDKCANKMLDLWQELQKT